MADAHHRYPQHLYSSPRHQTPDTHTRTHTHTLNTLNTHTNTRTHTHARTHAQHTHRVPSDVRGKVGKGGQLFGDVVHADCLLLVQAPDLGYSNIHSQTLLASQEIVKLSIVVWLTAHGRSTVFVAIALHTHSHVNTVHMHMI